MRTSLRSFSVGLLGLGAIAVVRTLIVLGIGGERGHLLFSDIGEASIVFVSAVLVLVFASLLKDPISRRQWLLLGIGSLAFAAGDTLWAIIELGTGEVPYPGLPDIFYVLSYVFMAIALVYAGFSIRHGADAHSASLISGITGLVGLGVLFFGLVEPLLLPARLSALELGLSVLYPLIDVVLLMAPAVFMLVIAFRSGKRHVMLPWGMVGAGLLVLALADGLFSGMSAYELYAGGSIVDYGWMAAHVALAVGASLAVDADAAVVQGAEPVQLAKPHVAADARAAMSEAATTRRGA